MKFLVVYGTRPEQIKLRSVVRELRAKGAIVDELFSGQSPDLVDAKNGPKFVWKNLAIGICWTVIKVFKKSPQYDAVIVQGDTATTFGAALGAFLAHTPVAHVEAGLRTYADEPWPEEAFRHMVGAIARWHFCPDLEAMQNLQNEGACYKRIHIVGNTVIDDLPKSDFRVLATFHRRENWGTPMKHALEQLNVFAANFGFEVTVIKHPNWSEHITVHEMAHTIFVDPMPRTEFLDLLQNADLFITDSGGNAEEAAWFGIPTIIYRNCTERTALVDNGAATLVRPKDDFVERYLLYDAVATELNKRTAYGMGTAGEQIADILEEELSE